MTGLAESLLEAGIRLRSATPLRTEHLICPKCGGGSKKEKSFAVTVDADGAGAVYVCHRGTCGWTGSVRERGAAAAAPRPPPRPPPRILTPPMTLRRPPWLATWAADRRISDETLDAFGVHAAPHWYSPERGTVDSLVFPYRHAGKLVNNKYRPLGSKEDQRQEKDAPPTLFNIDAIDGDDELIWVEGEPDCLAVHEAGMPNVVTLKDGSGKAGVRPPSDDDKRFLALTTHSDHLGRIKRFVLAGDADAPGEALRDELARRLGRHRCWTVSWPDGCKDAGEVLVRHGRPAIQEALAAALPYPIEGLQQIVDGTLLRLRHAGAPKTMTTGTRATDDLVSFPCEGRLIVIVGVPGHGKSSWMNFVSVHLMQEFGRRFLVFSPEMQPWQHYVSQSSAIWTDKPFWPVPGIVSMSDAEIVAAEAWLSRRLTMLVCDAEHEAPTVDWLLDRATLAVLQRGITDLIVDPVNEIEQVRGAMTETEYYGKMLQRLRAFAERHGCNVWLVAHPMKLRPATPGAKTPVPTMYDIAGSAHFFNKTDMGLCVYRADLSTEIHLLKSKFRRWGRAGGKVFIDHDPITGRYASPLTKTAFE